ncbi:CHAT domain-containing protein [Rhodothermus profundi]|uniref:CHAT domain-containing protein n=1 Tax=Rhodothermus profundi TaxID=633813 RepID=A0A1M6RBZ6_9BACT|nr:CHAT domain-containing protein [Rhodothermus profundi]SHK29962.1 CHAT domain-containing protein [Rhodothermus profundi]
MWLLALIFWLPVSVESPSENLCDSLRQFVAQLPQDARVAPEEVLPHAVQSLRRYRQCPGLTISELMHLYRRELSYLHALHRYAEVLALVDTFLTRFARQPDSLMFYQMYRWRGYEYYILGDLPAAAVAYSQALRYLPSNEIRARVSRLADLGAIYTRMRDYETAYQYYNQAQQLWDRIPASDSLRMWALVNDVFLGFASLLVSYPTIGGRSREAGLAEAARLIAEAKQALPQVSGLPSRLYLRQQLQLGLTEANLAYTLRRPERALQILDTLPSLARQLAEPHWHFEILYHRAMALWHARRLRQAEQAFREALSHADEALHDDARRRTLTRLAQLYEEQHRLSEAEHFFRAAIPYTETYLSRLQTTQWAILSTANWYEPYRGLTRVLLHQARYAEALQWLERSRAQNLQAFRTYHAWTRQMPLAKQRLRDSLVYALNQLRARLSDSSLPAQEMLALKSHEATLELRLRNLLTLPLLHPETPLARLQQRLAQVQAVALIYFIDTISGLFLLTPDTLRFFPLALTPDSLEHLLQRVSPVFAPQRMRSVRAARYFNLRVLHQLFQQLVAPALPHIPPETPLFIIPDGLLFQLPFAALVLDLNGPYEYDQATYLTERHPISILPALRLLLDSTKASTAQIDISSLGRSRFSNDPRLQAALPVVFRRQPLPDLPGVHEELERVTQHFARTQRWENQWATEPRFRQAAQQSRVLHLASHVLLHPTSSAYHAIVLSPAPGDDGILFLHELLWSPLSAELVVLSGCNTAAGEVLPGEGLEGLQYAILAAGARGVVATRWLVEDRSMATLMDRFYAHLAAGLPLDRALQQARLDFLAAASDEQRSPFYWAAPAFFGVPRVLPLTPRTRPPLPWAWILLLLLGVGMGVLFWWYRQRRRTYGSSLAV